MYVVAMLRDVGSDVSAGAQSDDDDRVAESARDVDGGIAERRELARGDARERPHTPLRFGVARQARNVDVVARGKESRAEELELLWRIRESVEQHEHARCSFAMPHENRAPANGDDAVVLRLPQLGASDGGGVVCRRRRVARSKAMLATNAAPAIAESETCMVRVGVVQNGRPVITTGRPVSGFPRLATRAPPDQNAHADTPHAPVDFRQDDPTFCRNPTEPHGQRPIRRPPRHARSADPQNAHPRADARLGHQRAHPAVLARSARRQPGIALSGAPAPRAARMDRQRLADDREQPARQVLPPHRVRHAAPSAPRPTSWRRYVEAVELILETREATS